jgi:hypothetical protein
MINIIADWISLQKMFAKTLHTVNRDYVILQTKSIVAWQNTVSCWMLNNSEACMIRKDGFDKIDISSPNVGNHCFPEDVLQSKR